MRFGLTRRGYYADFLVAPVAMAALLAWAMLAGHFGVAWMAAAIVGLGAWTLVEYLIHRFVFHLVEYAWRGHLVHHQKPAAYVGLSSIYTMSMFAAAFALLALTFGAAMASALLFGLLTGYTAYIVVHDAIHHSTIAPGHPLYAAKLRHVLHHKGVEANFGVVTAFWDRVFRTYAPVREERTDVD